MANLVTQIREEIVALPEVTLPRSKAAKILKSRWKSLSNGYGNGLTLSQVASVISRWSIDLPGASFVPTAVTSAFARAVRLIRARNLPTLCC